MGVQKRSIFCKILRCTVEWILYKRQHTSFLKVHEGMQKEKQLESAKICVHETFVVKMYADSFTD